MNRLPINFLNLAITWLLGATLVCAQEKVCPQEFSNHRVRSVRIKSRWLPPTGSSEFQISDVKNSIRLITRLKNGTPLSQYLLSKFSSSTKTLIDQYRPGSQPQPALVIAVVQELNRLLNGPLLFEKEAFAEVSISVDTQVLYEQKPSGGEGLFRLNRMLLEDAFRDELSRDSRLFLPLHRQAVVTPESLSATRLAVIRAINAQKKKYNSEFIALGKLPLVDVNLVTACLRKVPATTCQRERLTAKCVDVEIHPYTISTDPVFMGSILLPLPRSNRFTFLEHVPYPLRLLNPKFGLNHDQKLGTVPKFEISTDLLSIDDVLTGKGANTKRALLLDVTGSKSIGERFYSSQVNLSFVWRQIHPQIESVGVTASFKANSQPELNAVHLQNAFEMRGHLTLNPEFGFLNRIVLEAGYRRSNQKFSGSVAVPGFTTRENSFEGRSILEGRVLNGFVRLGVWIERSKPNLNKKSYQRAAALIGYEKEFPLGHHTLGIEGTFGLGHASENTPSYGLFYGGNTLQNFLYDDTSEPSMSVMPSGPLLRNFGRNQAGAVTATGTRVGANGHKHFNLNITIPIPGLSAPLIPDEVVLSQPKRTLRDLITFAVNSGQEALSVNLQDEGLSAEDADRKAAMIFKQVRPGITFLSRYGKVYSLKPLIMFDHASFSRSDLLRAQARNAIGAGIQFTIVVAKFETGYMRSLHPLSGDGRGNFVFRLAFENLF